MNTLKKLIALSSVMAMLVGQAYGQEQPYYDDSCCPAYCDSGYATTLSVAIPVVAIVVAAILIASTNHRHDHRHHGGSSSSCSSSSVHCHY